MTDSEIRKGSCLCGENTFTIKGDPSIYVICHCVNCQKVTGSAFMSNGLFKEEDVDLTGCKRFTVYADSANKSGRTVHRHFCSVCGSNLDIHPDPNYVKGVVSIPMALIEGFQDWTPNNEFCEETKCPFVKELVTKPAEASTYTTFLQGKNL
ncbi:hypothetical protein D9758_008744 [Tetrapyrgos nigripes]|uniref:CENP-V/GFA domain-containing protein n=1 Tax=Tetrapyrgos nigripes TaxID=182062 RepID=A0A8H5FXR6_9AGAR|nr:hypothetical protein D9758_008744 [Tetrapyrgos nigripes]